MKLKTTVELLSKEALVAYVKEHIGSEIEIDLSSAPANILLPWLRDKLGNKCIKCGSIENLIIHHVYGGGSILRLMFGTAGELRRIAKEWDNGKYILTCAKCHGSLEPKTFRCLAAKRDYVLQGLKARKERELVRIYNGTPGSAARGEVAYDRYDRWIIQADDKYNAVRIVKEIYGLE
jgi:hypothetical protein